MKFFINIDCLSTYGVEEGKEILKLQPRVGVRTFGQIKHILCTRLKGLKVTFESVRRKFVRCFNCCSKFTQRELVFF